MYCSTSLRWSAVPAVSTKRSSSSAASLAYSLGTIAYLQLGEDARDVVAYRFGTEVNKRGDGVVGVARGHEGEDLVLPLGQARECLIRSRYVVSFWFLAQPERLETAGKYDGHRQRPTICLPLAPLSGRNHSEMWAGCIVSLTTSSKSSLKGSRSASSRSLAEKASRVLAASYLRR
jgi:hypothetical protein